MHPRQRPAPRPHLLLARSFGGFSDDPAGSGKEDVLVRELLFEFAHEAGLDFVEGFEEGWGDGDEDGFFAVACVELETSEGTTRVSEL